MAADRRADAAFTRGPRAISTGLYTLDALLTGNFHALWEALRHLALPAVTLGLVIGGVLVRLVRVNMLQALRSDHVDAARARGLPERSVVLRHALRSALVPVVAVVGLQFALLLSGAVLTEATFSWPGLGAVALRLPAATATTPPSRGS